MFKKHPMHRITVALSLSSLLLFASVSLASAAPPKGGLVPDQAWSPSPSGEVTIAGVFCHGHTYAGNAGNNIIWTQGHQYCEVGPQQMTTYLYRCGWVAFGMCHGQTQVQVMGSAYNPGGGDFWNPSVGARYSNQLPSGTYMARTHHISFAPGAYQEGWSNGPLIVI
jgi:hypothetical protein